MNEFDAFYRSHLRLVYAMALARGLPFCTAEDLTQETFLRAWRHFGLLSGMEPPAQRAWLIRVLRNLESDGWRSGRLTAREAPVWSNGEEHATEPPQDPALRLDVARALAGLAETDREVVVLRYFLQMNSREIGEALQMPEGTVRRKLMECRSYLAERLAPWGPGGDRS